jgi:hypothetical protein
MEGILNNGLNYIPKTIQTLKELISYFWQPSMSRDYTRQNQNAERNQKPRKEIDKKKHLSLDNIMVLHVGQDANYMITMWGLKQSNCDERILLRNGQPEKPIIERCLQDNTELERKSIMDYMPSDYIEIYNEALRIGNYQCCLTILRGLEKHINQITEEKNKLLSLRGKN